MGNFGIGVPCFLLNKELTVQECDLAPLKLRKGERNDVEISYTVQANISTHHMNTSIMKLYRFCFFM
jgi:hypothetical protein